MFEREVREVCMCGIQAVMGVLIVDNDHHCMKVQRETALYNTHNQREGGEGKDKT